MTRRRRSPDRPLRALSLAVWGGVFLYFTAIDRLPVYLAAGFRPLVPIAGVTLILLALATLFARDAAWSGSSSEAAGRALPLWKFAQAVLLLAPILASAAAAPAGYSATTVWNRLGSTDSLAGAPPDVRAAAAMRSSDEFSASDEFIDDPMADIDGALPLPGEEPEIYATDLPEGEDVEAFFDPERYIQRTDDGRILAELTDLWSAAADPAFRKLYENAPVRFTAQLLKPKDPQQDAGGSGVQFKAARLMIFCCAADAQPVAVRIEAAAMPPGNDMDWIEVDGRAEFRVLGGEVVPVVAAERVEPAATPSELYLTY